MGSRPQSARSLYEKHFPKLASIFEAPEEPWCQTVKSKRDKKGNPWNPFDPENDRLVRELFG